jgi:hypothetical protein
MNSLDFGVSSGKGARLSILELSSCGVQKKAWSLGWRVGCNISYGGDISCFTRTFTAF